MPLKTSQMVSERPSREISIFSRLNDKNNFTGVTDCRLDYFRHTHSNPLQSPTGHMPYASSNTFFAYCRTYVLDNDILPLFDKASDGKGLLAVTHERILYCSINGHGTRQEPIPSLLYANPGRPTV